MKTLFISDLDGTLLNDDENLSEETVRIINELIDQNINFTIATARSYHSAKRLIEPLNIKLPAIFYNGSFIYDIAQSEYLLSNFLPNSPAMEIIEKFEDNGVFPLVHAIDEKGDAKIYYKGTFNRGQKEYVQNRLRNGDRRFTLVKDFSIVDKQHLIAIVCIDEKGQLEPLYQVMTKQYELTFHFGEDTYTKSHWLEVSHPDATKKKAVQFLKKHYAVDRLVCFGDNLNDLPMFEEADEAFAVANANEKVQEAATRVIGGNNEDGVAEFLQEYFQLDLGEKG